MTGLADKEHFNRNKAVLDNDSVHHQAQDVVGCSGAHLINCVFLDLYSKAVRKDKEQDERVVEGACVFP